MSTERISSLHAYGFCYSCYLAFMLNPSFSHSVMIFMLFSTFTPANLAKIMCACASMVSNIFASGVHALILSFFVCLDNLESLSSTLVYLWYSYSFIFIYPLLCTEICIEQK